MASSRRTCASWPDDVPEYVEAAVDVVERALALWPGGELALSFNGGKDCTILLGLVQVRRCPLAAPMRVLVHPASRSRAWPRPRPLHPRCLPTHCQLTHCCVSLRSPQLAEARKRQKLASSGASLSAEETSALFTSSVRMVYFVEEGCFPEQDEFIALAQRTYGFELQNVGQNMKENCAMLVREHGVRAFLMGTRRADPYAATLDNFSPSTNGWAPFMRVNPVLEWEYSMVWQFIRDFNIPYCSLYDKGYSSVGLMKNTEINQHLVRPDGTFRPAWELDRASACTERGGRGSNGSAASGDRSGPSSTSASGGERRTIALLLAPPEAQDEAGGSVVEEGGCETLWAALRAPLGDRGYGANALCTLSDGVDQWTEALRQHTAGSCLVFAVAPARVLIPALAAAFGGEGSSNDNAGEDQAGDWGLRRWQESLPGCVALDKNGLRMSALALADNTAGEVSEVSPTQLSEGHSYPWLARQCSVD